MKWPNEFQIELKWCGEIINYEQKLALAKKVAMRARDNDVIGFGSGSTSFLIVNELARRMKDDGIRLSALPTSPEIALACHSLGIPVDSMVNARPDWSFDGADEVDGDNNLIKGRGGAMFIEKLLICCSPKNLIVVDSTKLVDVLGAKFAVPVEVNPEALVYVKKKLSDFGAKEINLRLAKAKDGPVVSESGNYIFDVRFNEIYPNLEKDIKSVTGVIESGLFMGYDFEVITP